jgi:hypothetical protein
MKFESVSDLYFILAVFVPGFVFEGVLSKFVPRRQSSMRETFLLRLFTATAFNYALSSPLIFLLLTRTIFADSPGRQSATWLAIIFLFPVLMAIVTAKLSQDDVLANIFARLPRIFRLRTISPIPTGWDWKFGRTEPCYVLVTLKDGTEVAGYFGKDSMASSDQDRKDLYLEKLYTVPASGPWQPVPRTSGAYIDGSQIAFIEFRTGE